MSLSFTRGDMFAFPAEAIVNTVNCVGVMGKGVALEFKRRWPDNFRAYRKRCDGGSLRPGKVFVFEQADLFGGDGRRYLVNFPTKDHWRDPSRIEWIEAGLDDFASRARELAMKSIVMPPLGCGNGGLDWAKVRPLIERKLEGLSRHAEITVFEP